MKLYLMLAYYKIPEIKNPVIEQLITLLQQRGIELTIGIGENTLCNINTLRPDHDLYVLKSHADFWISAAHILKTAFNVQIVNSVDACIMVQNKMLCLNMLHNAGIRVPQTWLTGDFALMRSFLEKMPLIIKPIMSGRGKNIFIVHTQNHLAAIPFIPGTMLVQEYIEDKQQDLKIYVINNECFGICKPFSPGSYQFCGEACSLTAQHKAIALKCGKIMGLDLYGVDMIESSSGPVVVDVNYFPSYRGVKDAGVYLADYLQGCMENPCLRKESIETTSICYQTFRMQKV